MKKPELIIELRKMKVEFNETDTYNNLMKLYKEEKKLDAVFGMNEEKIEDFFQDKTLKDLEEEHIVDPEHMMLHKPRQEDIEERQYINGDDRRNKIIRSIVEFMPSLIGRSKAQPHEIQKMFDLYNAFYLRRDHPSCNLCVGRVYEAMRNIYNQYK